MDLRSRLSTLIAVRVVVSTLLVGSAILIELSRPGSFPVGPFFFLIGLAYAVSLAYLATLRFVERHAWLVDVQLAADAVLVLAFVQVTGGINSYFSSLLLLPIIAASTIRFRRGALLVAGFSAALYLALVAAQYVDALTFLPPSWRGMAVELPGVRFAQYTVATNLFGFLSVALLSGSLAEGVRSAGDRLRDASNQIEDLRAFNDHVIASLSGGLVATDPEGRVLTFNRGASSITGIEPDQAIGRPVADVLQLSPEFMDSLGTLSGTRNIRADLVFRLGERALEIGFTATTLVSPNGRTGYLLTFQDVTEIKRLEQSARRQQRLAAVGEMAAGIAHEIRNPLASMSGSIQVLRDELTLNDEQSQLMDIVLRESERLNETIRSFLAYARPQRRATGRVDLRSVVEDVARLLRNGADVRDDHAVLADVPSSPVWLEADEHQIRQVVWNLATNGLRAMRTGGRLRLSVESTPTVGSPGEVVLTVEDEGCGIPADQLDDIFQPFRSTFERGTGLGLAIVHRVVTDYGGEIHVSSEVGKGTEVRVRLPVRGPVAVRPQSAATLTVAGGVSR